ncbi:hypothetical protein CANARDRAFT_28513 [[Candida] arabinofermentans NRRL YB-2248]|uniref:AP-2 complex subunit alpha n=1 Tax=[Candida] arabinofermentans NRRL YB-2248 TaxID=983967 RepID=A0A1E4T0E1_9ASCO|nr:hypothetical protein CANARDRAFT_28513 [[Candida] arabinofermentans NRRL YB-2248]
MSPQMKGLVQFITDIRNSKEQEQEDKRIQSELTHIQKQFQTNQKLSGYHRKKYICKLLFVYLMGHDLHFGFQESIALLSSSVYSEKFIGYLAMGLFIQIKPELSTLLNQSIKNDISSSNEDFNSLALQFLSTISDDESYALAFEEDVFLLLRSPTTSTLVQKKAALTILKLLKCDSNLITRHPQWIPRIITLLDSEDYGLSLSVSSLIEEIAKLDYEACRSSITISINRLYELIVKETCPEKYCYYGVPAPWLTVKLFSLLETMIPDGSSIDIDSANRAKIKIILQKAISGAVNNTKNSKSTEAKNTNSFIMFGAISLAAHIDHSPDQSEQAAVALCSLLDSTDINTRYLSLGALIKIATRGDFSTLSVIKARFDKVFNLLRDRDVSIRRRSLDLIYTCCDSLTVENICSELLQYLNIAEFTMKSDVAVKVAVLAEKFATDAAWYVTTIMKLLSLAGNYVEDEVWQRLIQIVVNNDSIQGIACTLSVNYLRTESYPESLLKVSSFLLGEFGNQIVSSCSAGEQFQILNGKYYVCSVRSRSMLLSCFLKFCNRYPDLRPSILDLFEQETNSISSEIQQRALEYLKVAIREDNLMKIVVLDMPPFTSKISPLISRLGNVEEIQQSFKLPELKSSGSTPSLLSANHSSASLPFTRPSSPVKKFIAPPPPPPSRHPRKATMSSINTLGSLTNESRLSMTSSLHNPFDSESTSILSSNLSPNWKEGYYRMVHFDQGIFYENSLIKIIYRIRRDKSTIHFHLTYVNKSPISISGLTSELISNCTDKQDPSYLINILQHPESNVPENQRTIHTFDIMVRSKYLDSECPQYNLSFISGGLTTLKLKLPAVLLKCLNAGAPLQKELFFTRWDQIGSSLGSSGEHQVFIKLKKLRNKAVIARTLSLCGLGVLEGVDPSEWNIVCAGILTTLSGSSGCLARLEINPQDQSMVRITMRCTQAGLASILVESIGDLLINGM